MKLYMNNLMYDFLTQIRDEKGEVNMVAIVLIILVVLGLVVIFRDQLTSLLNTLFEKIQNEALTI